MIKLFKDGAKGNQINYMVIPFAYDYTANAESFEKYIKYLCNPNRNRWAPVSLKENNNELYEHILSLAAEDLTKSNESCEERLNSNYIAQALIMNRTDEAYPKEKYTIKDLPQTLSFSFEQIYLYLFNSGIGFLIFKMNYSELEELEHIILANNQVKSIKHCEIFEVKSKPDFLDVNEFVFLNEKKDGYFPLTDDTDSVKEKFVQKDLLPVPTDCIKELKIINRQDKKSLKIVYNEREKKPILYKEMINSLLTDIKVTTYFNQSLSNSLEKQMSNKANVFSANCIQYELKEEKAVQEAFFRLRKGYSKSYVPDGREYAEDNNEIYRPFIDSLWGVSREGCANLTYDSNEFMKFGYSNRTTSYFYLYIIGLHQYYGLLHLAKEISYLPATIDECVGDEVHSRLISIRNQCNFFYMKSIFEEVSHITHQAIFYSKLVQVLGIKNMQQELNFEIDRISAIVEQLKEHKLEEEKARLQELEKEKERVQKEEKERSIELEKIREKQRLDAKEEEEKKKETRAFWLSVFGVVFSLFSVISIMDDTLSFWTSIGELHSYYEGFEVCNSILTLGGIFSICIITILIIYLNYRKKVKSDTKQ